MREAIGPAFFFSIIKHQGAHGYIFPQNCLDKPTNNVKLPVFVDNAADKTSIDAVTKSQNFFHLTLKRILRSVPLLLLTHTTGFLRVLLIAAIYLRSQFHIVIG